MHSMESITHSKQGNGIVLNLCRACAIQPIPFLSYLKCPKSVCFSVRIGTLRIRHEDVFNIPMSVMFVNRIGSGVCPKSSQCFSAPPSKSVFVTSQLVHTFHIRNTHRAHRFAVKCLVFSTFTISHAVFCFRTRYHHEIRVWFVLCVFVFTSSGVSQRVPILRDSIHWRSGYGSI